MSGSAATHRMWLAGRVPERLGAGTVQAKPQVRDSAGRRDALHVEPRGGGVDVQLAVCVARAAGETHRSGTGSERNGGCLPAGRLRPARVGNEPSELSARPRRRDRIRPNMQLIQTGPRVVHKPLESQTNPR